MNVVEETNCHKNNCFRRLLGILEKRYDYYFDRLILSLCFNELFLYCLQSEDTIAMYIGMQALKNAIAAAVIFFWVCVLRIVMHVFMNFIFHYFDIWSYLCLLACLPLRVFIMMYRMYSFGPTWWLHDDNCNIIKIY